MENLILLQVVLALVEMVVTMRFPETEALPVALQIQEVVAEVTGVAEAKQLVKVL